MTATSRERAAGMTTAARPAQLRNLIQSERATVEPARLRQGPILGYDRPIADSGGGIGQPLRALSTLERMERNQEITGRQRQAGDEFAACFRAAGLDALKSADPARLRVGTFIVGAAGPNGNERARRRIAAAARALGGERSLPWECAYHVVGLEWSLREWAIKALRGNAHAAKGVLLAALAIIERDFGG